jgi:hypothetical protein
MLFIFIAIIMIGECLPNEWENYHNRNKVSLFSSIFADQ